MDFMNGISNGKSDKPCLMQMQSPISFDCDDKDGQLSMLDRSFSGCILLPFTKAMNPDVPGVVLVDNQPVQYTLKTLAIFRGAWVLGIRVAGIVERYDTIYSLHVEGFTDTDGNQMIPIDLELKTKPKQLPQPEHMEHEQVALQAAEEGIVLLKNENNVLPLSPCTLNIFGEGLHLFRAGIVGAGKINPRYVVDFKEAIRNSTEYELNENLASLYTTGNDKIPEDTMMEDARNLSMTGIVVLTRESGENLDNSSAKGEFYLTDDEDRLIKTVAQSFTQTVVILNVPYPIDVTFAEKYDVDALVCAGVGGMLGGQALLNVISGKVNPSGKLPDTWVKDYSDIPASKNFYDSANDGPRIDGDADVWMDTVYEEDIYVGYRYFDTFGVVPAYPFGYGLSYTTFNIEMGTVSYNNNEGLCCTASVTNTGMVSGKEVVQIYVGKPDGNLEKPCKELVEFEKTSLLAPGETQEFTFKIPPKHLTSYDEEQAAYIMEAGVYSVYIGANVANVQKAGTFTLEETNIIKQVKNRMIPVERPHVLSKNVPESTYPSGKYSGIKEHVSEIEPKRQLQLYMPTNSMVDNSEPLTFEDVVHNPELAHAFVAQLDVEELCRLTVCASAGWGMQDVGTAGGLAKLEDYNLPEFAVSDGNSGVNVKAKNIGFPTGTTCCASFNKELLRNVGRVLGEEAGSLNVSLLLVPGMNIHRNPLNGRHAEYFSEDPYLAGVMAGTYCAGVEETGVAGCYKHVIANNCESSRKRNQSIITERAIREIYFRAFELAMEIHSPHSIMTSYNAVNGVHAAADSELIRGLFREENDFEGFVMTDWNSYESCDIVEMVLGGNNWITPGSMDDKYTKPLAEAIANGKLSIECLRESVTYVIKAVAKSHKFKI